MSSRRRRSEYYHRRKQEMKQEKKRRKKLEKSKGGRSTRCRERLQRKHLRPSIFSAHLDDDDGGGIRNVLGKEPPSGIRGRAGELMVPRTWVGGLLRRKSWRRGLRDLGEWVGKQMKREMLTWTDTIQVCRVCRGTWVSSKRYS